jgi:hypothetical protein
MQIVQVDLEEDKPYEIYHIGDIHSGIIPSDDGKAIKAFNLCRNGTRTLFCGMGDYCEYREPGHPYFDAEQTDKTIDEQLDWVFSQFNKVKSKTLGILDGNHERKLSKLTTINNIRRYCTDHDIRYFGDMAHVTFNFPGGSKYTMVVSHGSGAAVTLGSKINKITKSARGLNVDAVVWGHVHELMTWPLASLDFSSKSSLARYTICGFSGCFLRTYMSDSTSYGEERHYDPTPIGFLVSILDPNKDIIQMRTELMDARK